MSDRFIEMLLRLAPRERMLLALMVVVLLAGAGIGWLLPLQERRAVAERELQEARALTAWVQARADQAQGLPQVGETRATDPIGTSGIEQGLIIAGLRDRVRGLSNSAGGSIELRLENVRFERMMQWVSASEGSWGYEIESLRIEKTGVPGLVIADFRLTPGTDG